MDIISYPIFHVSTDNHWDSDFYSISNAKTVLTVGTKVLRINYSSFTMQRSKKTKWISSQTKSKGTKPNCCSPYMRYIIPWSTSFCHPWVQNLKLHQLSSPTGASVLQSILHSHCCECHLQSPSPIGASVFLSMLITEDGPPPSAAW